MAHDSDSAVQLEAELAILAEVSVTLGKPLVKRRVNPPGGAWVEVDGVDPEMTLFVEAFAHQGSMKGGQKRKVALDVLKLITLQRLYPSAAAVLAFSDKEAEESISGWLRESINTWQVRR